MTQKNDLPAIFSISDYETLKVISDPLRGQILEALILQPLTVKQVGERIGVTATKLYYHINLMEKHGLIKVVSTQIVSGIIEKSYRATAQRIQINSNLLSPVSETDKDNINTLVLSTIETTRDDMLRSLQSHRADLEQDDRCIMISRQLSRFSDERADEFCQRLDILINEFRDADTELTNDQPFALTIAFYPSYYFHPEK